MTLSDSYSNGFDKHFLEQLADRFEFNSDDENLLIELNALFRRYQLDKRLFNDRSAENRLRANYQKLKLETERFRALLSSSEYEDLETDLYWAAVHNNELEPDTEIPVISGAEAKPGHAYLADLDYLLSLLDLAAETGTNQFAPTKGRKPNIPLKNAVRRIAYVWSNMLERRFTVDYHQGSGLTPAFEFVRVIFEKLDSAITENEIITAMRDVIADRNAASSS
ncbi:hypothetical protein RYZ27_02935 [Hyphomonas sp. FCG-A18]|uniref:hypothetical protein n=1 Tax=Hyphomonas sp. FCG-A18 TaxID=3080019 RepID=UPI002B306F50|nr:hypothetical protein RYZ27_02935 [Hyphomonas sp. FCG-A18]